MDDSRYSLLCDRIDDLIRLCETLDRENRALKAQATQWHVERGQLLEQKQLAQGRIEQMIERLRALEQGS